MQFSKEKRRKLFSLFIIISLCGIILGIILSGVRQFKLGSQQASIHQVADLSHTLVRQQANLFSVLLMNKADNNILTHNLARFTQENFIVNASLYNQNGELLANSSHNPANLPLAKNPHITQQVVEPIYTGTNLIGFLRVTFNGQFGQQANEILDRQFHRLYAQIIIVFLTGILFTSSLLYWKKKWQKLHLPTPFKNIENKITPPKYYRRRRYRKFK